MARLVLKALMDILPCSLLSKMASIVAVSEQVVEFIIRDYDVFGKKIFPA